MTKKSEKKDNSREGLTGLKLLQLLKLFLPWNTKTLARLEKFSDLDIEKLNSKANLEIKGLIIDVDDCIAENHKEILPENIEHLKKLTDKGIKVAVYSNMAKSDRYKPIEGFVTILTNIVPKPNKEGFQQAVDALNLPPENLVMIGDNYITDSGSIQLGIPFIKVEPIQSKKNIIMTAYSMLRNFYDKISRIHDKFRDKPINL